MDSPAGHPVTCDGCDVTVILPSADGRISLLPVTGWTGPPPLCPACSDDPGRVDRLPGVTALRAENERLRAALAEERDRADRLAGALRTNWDVLFRSPAVFISPLLHVLAEHDANRRALEHAP